MKSALLLLLTCSLYASDATRQEYLELVKSYPRLITPLGDSTEGEIEIILEPERMAAIEKKMGRDVGLIRREKYWIWINDACRFPGGAEGIYGRILWVKALESTPGVVVMPILPDGRIALNLNFRHATRSWEIELPRGNVNGNESLEAAAQREAMEETGMALEKLTLLGEMPPDTGLVTSLIPIFAAQVKSREDAQPEETEAIEDLLFLTRDEIKRAFKEGSYSCQLRGKEQRIAFRDPFLAYALLLSEM